MKIKGLAVWAGCALAASACGGDTGGADQAGREKQAAPVTVTAAVDGTFNELFADRMVQQLKEKYPHITLDLIQPTEGNKLDQLMATDRIPDIIFTFNGNLKSYKDKGLLYDIRQLMT